MNYDYDNTLSIIMVSPNLFAIYDGKTCLSKELLLFLKRFFFWFKSSKREKKKKAYPSK